MKKLIFKIIFKLLKMKNIHILEQNENVEIENLKIGDYCNFLLYKDIDKLKLGKNTSMRNYCNILVGSKAKLNIGEGVFMNNYCSINCLENIEIGENTLFGEGVKLYDNNHKFSTEGKLKVERQKFSTAPIKIGKNCWLGSNVTVLKGVNIGDNTIIGAGCLIYKDVPDNTIVKLDQDLIYQDIR